MMGELENSLGVPTFAYVAHWGGEYAVDADEEAGRLLTTAIVDRARGSDIEEVALILCGRGGEAVFADMVLRTLEHLEVGLKVVVADRVDGAIATVALGADEITMHPRAGVGAVDGGLLVVPGRPLDAGLWRYRERFAGIASGDTDAGDDVLPRLAHDEFHRAEQSGVAHRWLDDGVAMAFTAARLGKAGTATVRRLMEAGLAARVAPGPLAEQLDELLAWAREGLHLYRSPGERFRVSDEWGEEVEFEPATAVNVGAILTVDSAWVREVDTGSPDPYAPRLRGHWRRARA